MILNSVPGPLQDAQKCKNDTISIVLHCSKELKQIKKKTGKRSELIAEWSRSKRRIVQTYFVLARHLITYRAKKWPLQAR